jgi:hypothetical protein
MSLRKFLRRRAPASAILAWRRLKARQLVRDYSKIEHFADEPVNLKRMRFFRRESFPPSGPVPWLDRDDAEERIAERLAAGEIRAADAALCRAWRRDGFVLLPGFFDDEMLDDLWRSTVESIKAGNIPFSLDFMTENENYEGRALDLHVVVPELRQLLHYPQTLEIVSLLLGRPARPFQTIAFFVGSEQGVHSDSIHMTTYPEGYLVGAWAAAEDIHPDSGPLVYYPGSHRLPYYLSREVGIAPEETTLENPWESYSTKYEPFVAELVESQGLEPLVHTPKKGDLLLWHANLLHGGTARRDRERSRKSVVCHYFAEGAVCYHDLSAKLARIE